MTGSSSNCLNAPLVRSLSISHIIIFFIYILPHFLEINIECALVSFIPAYLQSIFGYIHILSSFFYIIPHNPLDFYDNQNYYDIHVIQNEKLHFFAIRCISFITYIADSNAFL